MSSGAAGQSDDPGKSGSAVARGRARVASSAPNRAFSGRSIPLSGLLLFLLADQTPLSVGALVLVFYGEREGPEPSTPAI